MSKRTSDEEKELLEHRDDPEEWDKQAAPVQVRLSRTEVLSVRIPSQLMDALEDAAAAAGETVSEFVRKAIESTLQDVRPFAGSIINRSVSYGTFQQTDFRVWSEPSGRTEEAQHTLQAVTK